MLVSHSNQFIYVHIFKTAGRSIKQALGPYSDFCGRDLNLFQRILHILGKKEDLYAETLPANFSSDSLAGHCSAAVIREFSPNHFNDYFSFAFVRNPWDWQVSLYCFIVRNRAHSHHELVSSLGSFQCYLKWRCEYARRLQRSFITDRSGKIIVDFVGRFESLQQDFDTICEKIGIEKTNLPHLNSSNSRNYREFYNLESQLLVAKYFARDIELFGYEF